MKNHILKFIIAFTLIFLVSQDPLPSAGVAIVLMLVDSFFKFLNDVQESGKS